MIEVAHSMSRVRIPAGTGDVKGLRAEEGFPIPVGSLLGRRRRSCGLSRKRSAVMSSFHGLCCVMMLS